MKKIMITALLLSGCSSDRIEESVLGPVNLYHGALVDIHDSYIVQRLKNIDQAGTPYHYCGLPSLSRYDHSLGALYLVQHYGGDLNEQIAALTHDASHTAFSHIADTLFNCEGYQDEIHEYSLDSMGLSEIVKPYNICLKDINPDNKHFLRQEQPLPDLCADRIEYNLHTGLVSSLITNEDVQLILSHLFYKDGKWFFNDPVVAKKFSNLSLYLTENVWGSKKNVYVYHLTAKMLKRAIKLKLFELKTFHFGTDVDILNALNQSTDPEIIFYREEIKRTRMTADLHHLDSISGSSVEKKWIKPKFRGVDPLIFVENKFKRLTEMDKDYKAEYDRIKKKMTRGYEISVPIYAQ